MLTIEERNAIYKIAIEQWGPIAQKVKAIEEMAELIQALCKDFFGKLDLLNAVEETADVEIMMEQLRIMFGSDAIDDAKQFKIERLAAMLAGFELEDKSK